MSPEPRDTSTGRAAAAEATRASGQVGMWAAAEMAAQPFQAQANQASQAAELLAMEALGQARRLVELASEGDRLMALMDRWGNTAPGQFSGRLFEWYLEATANMNAAEAGSSTRTWMTELGGPGVPADPASAADLTSVAGDGAVLAQAQAKVISQTSQRVHQLAQDKYHGMQLLIPSDHATSTSDLLKRRLAQADPDFLKRADYEDVQERLTDRVRAGAVQSDPIDSDSLRAGASDPHHMLDGMREQENGRYDQFDSARVHEQHQAVMAELEGIGAAALTAGAVGATVSGLISAARTAAAVRAGSMAPAAAAATAASDAAAAFARSAYVGGAGQTLTLAAQHGLVPAGLGSGTLPFAIAKASVGVGRASLRFARGEISAQQCAQESVTSVTGVSLVWAASVVGQAVIPVPVVGAMVGGMVGSLCTTIAAQGISGVVAMRSQAALEWQVLAELEVELAATLIVHAEERRLVTELARAHELHFAEVILPALNGLDSALATGDMQQALERASAIIMAHGHEPLFLTEAEFEQWMTDPLTALVLKPNARIPRVK